MSTQAQGELVERGVTLTRTFDAPRELVFRAWVDPQHLSLWWDPKTFTAPECKIDAKVGGSWYILMRGPNGQEYPCGGFYREIVEPERLVFTNHPFDADGEPMIEGLTTVTFVEENGKTRLTLHTRAKGGGTLVAQMVSGMEAGWTQSIDKLEESFGEMAPRQIVTTRIFNAPRDVVFKAWTDPEQLAQWWGPKGFTNTFYEFDLRPGAYWRFIMHAPNGTDFPNESLFDEIIPPRLIRFRHLSSHFFQVTVVFTDRGDKTKITWRMLFDNPAELDKVKSFAVPANEQNMDRLAAVLAKI